MYWKITKPTRSSTVKWVLNSMSSLPNDEDLIGARHIDSLTFISVVTALSSRSGRDFNLETISTTRLRTITGLAEMFYGTAEEESTTR
jgi:acyl carrier protein